MSEPTQSSAHLLFKVAGTFWAVDVTSVHKVHDQLSIQTVPGTHSWFLGLAPVDGQLLPVTDLGAWLKSSPADGPVLHLTANLGSCGLRVENIMGTQTIPITPSAFNAAHTLMAGALPEVIRVDGTDFRVVDMSLLAQSPAFVAIREAICA